MRIAVLFLLAAACLVAGAPRSASAETVDIPAGNVAALVNAIAAANASAEDDIINLAAGSTYTLTDVDNITNGNNGLPSIANAATAGTLTINGNGATIERQRGEELLYRIFHLSPGADLTLNDLHVTGGATAGHDFTNFPDYHGAGILNVGGSLTINGGSVDGNGLEGEGVTEPGGDGIANVASNSSPFASLTMSNSSASGNGRAGVFNQSDEFPGTATAILDNVTVDNNGGSGIDNIAGFAGTADLTMTGGSASDNAREGLSNTAAFGATSTMTLTGVVIERNDGHGIYNLANVASGVASLRADRLTIADNGGDGIFNRANDGGEEATAFITNSTIARNDGDGVSTVSDDGGTAKTLVIGSLIEGNEGTGLDAEVAESGETTIVAVNSTIANNNQDGINLYSEVGGSGRVGLVNVTVANNANRGLVTRRDVEGQDVADIVAIHTIVTGSGAANCDFADDPLAATRNLADDGSCGDGFTEVTTDELDLGPLQNNGGPTRTFALGGDSVAIDLGELSTCENPAPSDFDFQLAASGPYDQRGAGFPRIVGESCDIGAFEAFSREADLRIEKVANIDPVLTGDELTYTITVANDGPDAATGVTVTDTLPEGVTLLEADGCTGTDGILTCALGTLAPGASAGVTVAVAAPGERGTLTNTATVSASTADPDTTNNTDSASTRVGAPELHIDKEGPDVAPPEAEVVYAITVTNTGDGEAREVVISETLTGGSLRSVDAPTGVECEIDGNTATCTLDNPLQPGGEVVIWVHTTAPDTLGTTGMINRVCVATTTPGDDAGDNCAEAGTSVVADVSIPPLPVVGPHLYQREPRPTPEPTETPDPTATATPAPGATATPEPTATATGEPEPTGTVTSEPTAPTPTATATPDSGTGADGTTPMATPTPIREAPMPPETGSGGASGNGSAKWLALLGMGVVLLGAGALTVARRRA